MILKCCERPSKEEDSFEQHGSPGAGCLSGCTRQRTEPDGWPRRLDPGTEEKRSPSFEKYALLGKGWASSIFGCAPFETV